VAGWLYTQINVRHRELNPDTVTHLSTDLCTVQYYIHSTELWLRLSVGW